MPFDLQIQAKISIDKHNPSKFMNDIESVDNVYHWSSKSAYKSGGSSNRLSCKSFEDLTTPIASATADGSLECRLSPKVFTNISDVTPVSQSLEDLKTQSELYEDLEPTTSFMKKHSLQDLTVFSTDAASQVSLYSEFVFPGVSDVFLMR